MENHSLKEWRTDGSIKTFQLSDKSFKPKEPKKIRLKIYGK